MSKQVVVTGLGIAAPNGIGVDDFSQALREGKSGIRSLPELKDLNFRCTVGGVPPLRDEDMLRFVSPQLLDRLAADGIRFGVFAACEAWEDAGFKVDQTKEDDVKWDTQLIFGSGLAGGEVLAAGVRNVDIGKVKRLGSKTVPNTMASGVSAFLGGILGIGGRVTTNASACATGTEAMIMGYEAIMRGECDRVLVGSCDSAGTIVRSGFDAMRVLNSASNDDPQRASRPLSASAGGFIPSGGAGAIVLEDREKALERGARVYVEVLGGQINSGGQRQGGSMTAPNPEGVRRCILGALDNAGIGPGDVDLISGHLTATMFDAKEVGLWVETLNRSGKDFPYLQALKGLTGHALSASGSLEAVAAIVQLYYGFLHPNVNCEDLHPDVASLIDPSRIPMEEAPFDGEICISSSFGFGDVNACVVLKK
jgi:3-oxoacyl-(acyl-carrier-protein) synthase